MSQALLAVYGSLRRGPHSELGAATTLGLDACLEPRGECRLPGRLYDLGEYPGLVRAEAADVSPASFVMGELFRLSGDGTLDALDRYEGYDPSDPEHSPFVREQIVLPSPQLEAWVYFYNGPVEGRPQVESGDWAEYLRTRPSL